MSGDRLLPTFLIVGAGKSGTTSLYRYLSEHPNVFMPTHKEPKYFAFVGHRPDWRGPADRYEIADTVFDFDEYRRLFVGASSNHSARGEASTLYFYAPEAAKNIRRAIPNVRLIALLREPVARAYSHHAMAVRSGFEPEWDFRTAFLAEDDRKRAGWGTYYHYRSIGLYADHIQRFLGEFDRDQLCVLFSDELLSSPEKALARVHDFLGLPDLASVTVRHENSGAYPRSRFLHSILTSTVARVVREALPEKALGLARAIKRNTMAPVPPLDRSVGAELYNLHYREQVERLQDILDVDLSRWHRNYS